MFGCSVTIFQTSHPCLVIGGGSGLSTTSPRNWSVSLPPRSPELLRTRSEMLHPFVNVQYNDHIAAPAPPSPSMMTTFSDDSDITIPYHYSPISPLSIGAPEFCACIWPTLASWCLVCNTQQ